MTIDTQDSNGLILFGRGTVTGNGFDPTDGSWSFSGDDTGGSVFAYSSNTVTIPEPGIVALLGLGMLGFGINRRGSRSLRRS